MRRKSYSSCPVREKDGSAFRVTLNFKKLQCQMLIGSLFEDYRRHTVDFFKLPLSLSVKLVPFSDQYLLAIVNNKEITDTAI
jgi:hypothetical protein